MRGRVFRGSPQSLALYQPFIDTKTPQPKGAVVGVKSQLAKLMWFHPFTLPSNTINVLLDGLKGGGKSTFAKSMCLRLSMMQAYNVVGERERWRVRITTRKSEGGAAEYLPLLNKLHATVYALGHGERINLLGLLRRLTDMINVSINVVQEIGKRRDDSKVSVAVTVAVTQLYNMNPALVGEALIKEKLRSLTLDDFREYYKTLRGETLNAFKDEFSEDPQLIAQLNLNDDAFPHVDESFLAAADFAANCFDELMGSSYGDVFGGKNSLYDILTQRFVMLDVEDIPENASEMLDAVLMKAEASAIRYSREDIGTDRDMTRIVPHMAIRDEEGGTATSLMHLRYAANKQNKSRAYGTTEWSLEQYNFQIAEAGSVGTEIRNLGRQIDNGYDVRVLFRQPDDDDILNKFSRQLRMSDQFIDNLTTLEVGEAYLWVRDRPPVRFQHLLFDEEIPLIQTNASRQRGSKSTPLWTQNETIRRLGLAEKNQIQLTGSAI